MSINPNDYKCQVNRSLARKMMMIEMRGGECEICGYNKNISSLHLHHNDPKIKKFELNSRTLANKSLKHILNEFEKCSLLCANCHSEFHHPELNIDNVRNKLLTEIKDKKDSFLNIRKGKPNCIDCGIEINYLSKRCIACNNIYRRTCIRPSKDELHTMKLEIGTKAMSNIFNVHPKTIRRWLL